jgi:hypothetical protein
MGSVPAPSPAASAPGIEGCAKMSANVVGPVLANVYEVPGSDLRYS